MNYDQQRPVGNQKLDPAELWLVIGEYFESEQNGCRWDWFITIFGGPDAFEQTHAYKFVSGVACLLTFNFPVFDGSSQNSLTQ